MTSTAKLHRLGIGGGQRRRRQLYIAFRGLQRWLEISGWRISVMTLGAGQNTLAVGAVRLEGVRLMTESNLPVFI